MKFDQLEYSKANLVLSFIHKMDSQDVLVEAANNLRLGNGNGALEVGASRATQGQGRYSAPT